MGDHRIVDRISVFGNVEIFLDNTPSERKGQWAPTPLRYSFVSVILSVLKEVPAEPVTLADAERTHILHTLRRTVGGNA